MLQGTSIFTACYTEWELDQGEISIQENKLMLQNGWVLLIPLLCIADDEDLENISV